MNSQPLVTVICTCFNKGEWIKKTLSSILEQVTSFTFDVLVIDDASTDQSRDIINEFIDRYPNQVKAVFHKDNIGITRTWKEACPLAKGEYIARCDGDDYWIRNDKLQLQVDALQEVDALWCNADFDMVDSQGDLIEAQCFERGIIPLADTYEKMLATKGFTMPSSWLVRADVLKEATEHISPDAQDDTFDIQLELFRRTKLMYLPMVLATYRVNAGSDSRPKSPTAALTRYEGLKFTQLKYLAQFPDVDLSEIARLLIEKNAVYEMDIYRRDQLIMQLQKNCSETQAAYDRVINSKRWQLFSKLDKLLMR